VHVLTPLVRLDQLKRMSWVRKRRMTPATVSQAESAAEMHLYSGVIPTATHVLRLVEEKGLWPEVAGPDQGGSTEPQDSLLSPPTNCII
jgi:hypothetical protein